MTRANFKSMLLKAYPWLLLSDISLYEAIRIACEREFIDPKLNEDERDQLRRRARQLHTFGSITFDDETEVK